MSGRLALSCLLGARSLTDGPVAVLLLSHPLVCGHQGGAGHCVLADCDMLRYLHGYRGRRGVQSLSRGVTFMSVVESFLPTSALTGGPRSPVVAWGTGPSQPSSDAFSAVASLDEFFPETVLSRLRYIRPWKRGGTGPGGQCRTVL